MASEWAHHCHTAHQKSVLERWLTTYYSTQVHHTNSIPRNRHFHPASSHTTNNNLLLSPPKSIPSQPLPERRCFHSFQGPVAQRYWIPNSTTSRQSSAPMNAGNQHSASTNRFHCRFELGHRC